MTILKHITKLSFKCLETVCLKIVFIFSLYSIEHLHCHYRVNLFLFRLKCPNTFNNIHLPYYVGNWLVRDATQGGQAKCSENIIEIYHRVARSFLSEPPHSSNPSFLYICYLHFPHGFKQALQENRAFLLSSEPPPIVLSSR